MMDYFKTIILFPKKYVDQENAKQDTTITGKADKTYVDQENGNQNTGIAGKAKKKKTFCYMMVL